MRPTKYKPEYCDTIYEYMKKGNSVSAAAELIGVHRDTLYGWERVYPEFKDSFLRARQAACAYWEAQIEKIAQGDVDGKTANAQVKSLQVILGSRFRDLYGQSSKQEIEIKEHTKISDDELDRQIQMHMAKITDDSSESDELH